MPARARAHASQRTVWIDRQIIRSIIELTYDVQMLLAVTSNLIFIFIFILENEWPFSYIKFVIWFLFLN